MSDWDTVIGLEVHVQLATNTKIFSGASTAFGAEPNTQACAIDLAMPGTLPPGTKEAEQARGTGSLLVYATCTRELRCPVRAPAAGTPK